MTDAQEKGKIMAKQLKKMQAHADINRHKQKAKLDTRQQTKAKDIAGMAQHGKPSKKALEKPSEEKIAEVLFEEYGFAQRVADRLSISYQTVYAAIKASPYLQEVQKLARERYADELEEISWEEGKNDPSFHRDTLKIFLLKSLKRGTYAQDQADSSKVLTDALAFVLDKSKSPVEQ